MLEAPGELRKGHSKNTFLLYYPHFFSVTGATKKEDLLLGRKDMTNLDSVFKSSDITLSTKVCIFKAMVFPVVMYGCERWSVKKAGCQRIDAFKLEKTSAREDS